MRLSLPTAALLSLFATRLLIADDNCAAENSRSQATVAESREQRMAAAADTTIDPGANGGIHIHGWNNQDVLVRACIRASASTESAARSLLSSVTIARGAGDIEPSGPASSSSDHWSVSYEIWMPTRSSIHAHSVNGGINIEAIDGQIRFQTQNGGVHLVNLAGDVEGSTQNGGLTVELAGPAWTGSGLRAETQNGGVTIRVPDGYSGQIEASTVNGGIHTDFPVQLNGRTMTLNLGSGGSLLHIKTSNGGVNIKKV